MHPRTRVDRIYARELAPTTRPLIYRTNTTHNQHVHSIDTARYSMPCRREMALSGLGRGTTKQQASAGQREPHLALIGDPASGPAAADIRLTTPIVVSIYFLSQTKPFPKYELTQKTHFFLHTRTQCIHDEVCPLPGGPPAGDGRVRTRWVSRHSVPRCGNREGYM